MNARTAATAADSASRKRSASKGTPAAPQTRSPSMWMSVPPASKITARMPAGSGASATGLTSALRGQLFPNQRLELVRDRVDLAGVEALDQDPQERLGSGVAEEDAAARLERLFGAGQGLADLRRVVDGDPARHADVAQCLRDLLERGELGQAAAVAVDDPGEDERG